MIEYNNKKPLRLISLFSGYDAQLLSLERLKRAYPDFDYVCVGWSEIDKIQAAGIPKTQQYKLAGNSLVTSVFYHLLRKLLIEKDNENRQLELF